MRNTMRMIAVLTLIGLVSGTALVFMYKYAHPLILDNQKSEIENGIFRIFPKGKSYDKEIIDNEALFKVRDKSGALLGYAFLAEGNGYQGRILIMAGIKADLETLAGIEILESQETPGLGQEITKDEFKAQFKNLKTLPKITYVKNIKPEKPNEIQAITGATVSSEAICSMLNEKIEKIRSLLKD